MQRLPRHEGRSLREGGNLVPHPAPYFQGNWFPGARPPSLHAADPGGGQAQAGSHLELVGGVGGGRSQSQQEGGTNRAGGSWREAAAPDPRDPEADGAAQAGGQAFESCPSLTL